jgi:hypothetical protein
MNIDSSLAGSLIGKGTSISGNLRWLSRILLPHKKRERDLGVAIEEQMGRSAGEVASFLYLSCRVLVDNL